MAQNIFATGMDAFDRSYDRGQAMQQDRARMQAGRSLASGDRRGAMQQFGQAGLTDDVRQVQADQMRIDQDERAVEQETYDRDQAEQKTRADVLVKVAQGLKSVPAGQRKAALSQITPVFQNVGIDPVMFNELTDEQLTDQALDMFSGEIENSVKLFNTSSGVVAVDEQALSRNLQDPNASRVVYQDPLAGEYRRAQIDATRARAGAAGASADAARARADRTRRMPVGQAGGRGSADPGALQAIEAAMRARGLL